MSISRITTVEELPDLDDMIEATMDQPHLDSINAIVERIFEDWDCQVPLAEVKAAVWKAVDTKRNEGE
jgi:hypothetical protein